ncbi:hypothetical protein SAY86_001754 [Trapa natans]|uniref:Alpha/beta hydrolase fold-3 domain-containing protein n=1 Tax=Trapa natans TaxID=22666 RepID=A0AAN7LPH1_TRANT|nr:hypothetical protein SAY86_001754 [Trapa natans]
MKMHEEYAYGAAIEAIPKLPLSLPWMTHIAVSLVSHFTDYIMRRSDGTVNRSLIRLLDLKSPRIISPIPNVSSTDLILDPTRNLWFRVFSPSFASSFDKPLPVIFFIHGGGFTFLSPDSLGYDIFCRRLARKLPAIVISVNYRLCPEYRFPSQYDDAFDVLKYVDEHPSVLPPEADLGRCFLAGDSAGGNIIHHVAIRACRSTFEAVRIRGMISIQPFFGGEERTAAEIQMPVAPIVSVEKTDWCWKAFLPKGEDRDHWAVNVSGPNAVEVAGLEEFPAVLLFVAGFDPLRDWQKRYYEWLKRSGKEADLVEYPNTIHGFHMFPDLPESAQIFSEITDFVALKAKAR